MRLIFLVPILAYGAFVVWHTLIPVPPDQARALAMVSANMYLFYLVCVILYLAWNRGRDWQVVFCWSIIVTAFFLRLAVRG